VVVVVAAPARANPELGAPNQMPILGKVHAPVLLDDDASQVFFFYRRYLGTTARAGRAPSKKLLLLQ
jgi:hypothetical protein